MARILRTDPFPTTGEIAPDATVVTLHAGVAAALNVPHVSLRHLALDALRTAGLVPASRLAARHILKRAISSVMTGIDPAAEASRMSNSLDVILRTGIDPQKLIEIGSAKVKNLGRVAAAYREALRARSLIDAAEILIVAASLPLTKRKLCVYGYFRARSEEAAFINAICGDGSEYFLPIHENKLFGINKRWAGWLESEGWEPESGNLQSQSCGQSLAARYIGGTEVVPECPAFWYRNVSDECRGVLSQVKQQLSAGTLAHRIAIVCRDQETYAPILLEIANEYQIPLRFRNEISLGQTAFGGFVKVLVDAVHSELSYEAGARLFKHRFGPDLSGEAWKEARTRRVSGREDWQSVGTDTTPLQWPEKQSFAAWIETLKSVVEGYGVGPALRADARELLAYESFFAALDVAAQLETGPEVSRDGLRAAVLDILTEEKVPFRAEHGGVGVFDPDAMIGSSYDLIFVMGLSEGIFPSGVQEDAVVDFFERRELREKGIEFADAAEVARWEALSFFFTLSAAEQQVTLSHSSSVDNRQSLASSFFDSLDLKPLSAKADMAASAMERRRLLLRHELSFPDDSAIEPARHQQKVETSRESTEPYDEYDGVTGIGIDPVKRGWSVSQLTMIGQCGFKWWARKSLRLDEVSEIETGMDYTKRGTFYHRVLEIAVDRAKDAEDIRAATIAEIDTAFAEAEADEETPLPQFSNWELQRAEHIRAIKKAVKATDFIKYGARVVALEARFELEWNGFKMTGAIDRIDDTPNGLIAIDYKTSSQPPKGAKDDRGRLGIDVQIPIYAKVALPHLYPDGNFGESMYYSLTKGIVLAPKRSADLEPVVQLLTRIRGDLGKGSFAVDPDTNLDACQYCEFDSVCRKGPRLERKNSV